MTIADRLSELIVEKRVVKKDLAAKIGIPQSTLQTWLSRGDDFPSKYVMPICRILDVSPEYLLSGVAVPLPEIPSDYVKITEDERFLIDTFRSLDREGVIVVTNEAIREARRVRTGTGSGASEGCAG